MGTILNIFGEGQLVMSSDNYDEFFVNFNREMELLNINLDEAGFVFKGFDQDGLYIGDIDMADYKGLLDMVMCAEFSYTIEILVYRKYEI